MRTLRFPARAANLGRRFADCRILAVELVAAGRDPADQLPVLPAVAWVHPGGRWDRLEPDRKLAVDPFAGEIWIPVLALGAGLVAF